MKRSLIALCVVVGLAACGGAPKCESVSIENALLTDCAGTGTGAYCRCMVGAIMHDYACTQIQNWTTQIPGSELLDIEEGCR